VAKHYLKLSKILKKLLYDHRMSASDLAREVNLPTPTVHRLVTGKTTRPYMSSLNPIADFFAVNVDQLKGECPLPEKTENTELPTPSTIKEIPILEWNDIEQLNSGPSTKAHKEVVAVDNTLPEGVFATKLTDSSMEPYFPKNSLLVINPNKRVADRCFVLAKITESDLIIFRQLLHDGENHYLKSLNPDLNAFPMRLMKQEDKLLGVMIEFRYKYEDF
jgi:SOS-response transcriptional repressor LexA